MHGKRGTRLAGMPGIAWRGNARQTEERTNMTPEATPMNEPLLDTAACDAVGALSAGESAAYQQELAMADETVRKTDRQLRETAARLTAASPHMAPPAGLRERILQATAPATFRIEDYRKVTREDLRFYKWGFYAAACFLVVAALYNINTRNSLDQANTQVAALQQQKQQLAVAVQQQDVVLTAFVKFPNQLVWRDSAGQPFARGVFDPKTQEALLIFPQEIVPAGAKPQLTLQGVPYKTVMLTAPASLLGFGTPELPKINVANLLDVKQTTPDNSAKPQVAGFSSFGE
jgi:hypothetical protein